MERRTARISKEPEVRRQEILDTAMTVFLEKGYEAATMRDIAAKMNVVPGLCYRYFESKQVLYDTVIEAYVKDITAPMLRILKEEEDSLDEFLNKMERLFLQTDGRERYHLFFHKKENHSLQTLLSARICETLEPFVEVRLRRMKEQGLVNVNNPALTASYLLFGPAPILENDELSTQDRVEELHLLMGKTLH